MKTENKKPRSPQQPPATKNASSVSDHLEWIRRRAYELYEQSGRQEGHAQEHWLLAEAELAAARGRIQKSPGS
jgi:hypothetical protein